MNHICPNCDEVLELTSCVESLEQMVCGLCNSKINLDVYTQCFSCRSYYLFTFTHCPDCGVYKESTAQVPELNYLYIKSESDYADAVSFIKTCNILGVDTEGNSLDPFTNELLLVQIGNEELVCVFDINWFGKLREEQFWVDTRKLFLAHNAKYDYKVLKYSLGITLQHVFDTFLAERILTCGLERRNSLKEVVKKYLNEEMDKEVRDEFIHMTTATFSQKMSRELIEYSARDVQLLPLIYEIQKRELAHHDLLKVANLEFQVCKVVSEMELRGIYVDTNSWQNIIDFCADKKNLVLDQIHNLLIEQGFRQGLFGEAQINLNSVKVLKEIFEKIGVEIKSTADADLAEVDHPFAKLMREYRKYEKQLSSFGESFLKLVRSETSRVHPSFQQIGADTGRFSCNNPNLQQIPAEEVYRSSFKAPSGRKIVACDYSQQELRLLASLSGDAKFIKFYEDGVDLHTATASMMFNIPIEKVEKETHRKVAKTINFGLAYGQGAKKLGQTIGVSEEEAVQMIDKYFSQFTFIRDWLENAAKDAQTKGFSKTLLNRKRFYKIPHEDDVDFKQTLSSIGRQGKNTPIQGSGVDMIKMAMVLIHQRLQAAALDAFLINAVHDELVVEASEADATAAAEIVKNAMEEAGRQLAPNVPIVAEVGIGDYWKH